MGVLDEMVSWRHSFEAGKLRPHGIRQPRMQDDERFAARVDRVGVHRQDLSVPMSEWENPPGGAWRGLRHAPLGALYVTSERAFVVGNRPTDVRREWSWADQDSVALLPVPIGVAIRSGPEDSEADVVGSEWNPYIIGTVPTRSRLLTDWLKVSAAFAAYQGRLDEWFEQLAPTETSTDPGADDPS